MWMWGHVLYLNYHLQFSDCEDILTGRREIRFLYSLYSSRSCRVQRNSRHLQQGYFNTLLDTLFWKVSSYPSRQRSRRGIYWFHVVRPSVRPSVDGIASAVYLPQYLTDLFHIDTSYQPTLEDGLRFWKKNPKLWFRANLIDLWGLRGVTVIRSVDLLDLFYLVISEEMEKANFGKWKFSSYREWGVGGGGWGGGGCMQYSTLVQTRGQIILRKMHTVTETHYYACTWIFKNVEYSRIRCQYKVGIGKAYST